MPLLIGLYYIVCAGLAIHELQFHQFESRDSNIAPHFIQHISIQNNFIQQRHSNCVF